MTTPGPFEPAPKPKLEARVVFQPSGKRGTIATGISLLQAARKLGVDLDTVCGGRGICGRCQIDIVEAPSAKLGIFSKATHLSPWNEVEARYAEKRGALKPGRRLGCQAKIKGDLIVDVPAESQLHRQIIRKDVSSYVVTLDPVVQAYFVEVNLPDMKVPASDLTRLLAALERDWALTGLEISLPVLRDLQKILRAGNWQVTAAVRAGREIVALYPGLMERLFGLAVDIGSTTIAAHLCDLSAGAVIASSGMMNPQIRFGEDLMSRVSHVMMNPSGTSEMAALVRTAINGSARELAENANIEHTQIVELVAVGNPVMHHIFLGLDPVELGGAPFALTLDKAYDVSAHELGIHLAPGAKIHLLPCIAGHVGADASAVLLSQALHLHDEITLIVDIGTNAELFLGNREKMLACSSPTGPAFEGAQISAGQRAAPGAIERFRIDRASLEPRFKLVGCDLWSDEPGFEAATAATGVTGICGSGIIEAVGELYLSGILCSDGVINGSMAARNPRIIADGRTFNYLILNQERPIAVTQSDIRAIQLAKAALNAGAKLLMQHYGTAHVDAIVLAGAFGSYIDPLYAMALGLLPDCALDKVSSAGNAAGTGAIIALLNLASRTELAKSVSRIEKIETALDANFQRYFVEAMAIPHQSDPYVELGKYVVMPPQVTRSSKPGQRRRHRQDR